MAHLVPVLMAYCARLSQSNSGVCRIPYESVPNWMRRGLLESTALGHFLLLLVKRILPLP